MGRFRILLLVMAVVGTLAGVIGMKSYYYTKTDPKFCSTCHLMDKAFEAWGKSVHNRVTCQTCHPAQIFEEAQLGWNWLVKNPKLVDPHKKVPREVCEGCHNSGDQAKWKQIQDTAGHRKHAFERRLDCLNCHVSSLHNFPAPPTVCVKCHKAEKLKLGNFDQNHCVACHDFLSPADSLVPEATTCRGCHKDPGAQAPSDAPWNMMSRRLGLTLKRGKDRWVTKGHENCLGCHRAHQQKFDDPVDCLKCHKPLLEEGKHLTEGRLGGCRDCHNPHKPRT